MKTRNVQLRSIKGASMVEFAVSMVVFVIFIFIPCVNIGFVPVRYMLCNSILSSFSSQLARSEKLSEAFDTLAADTSWKSTLSKFGVSVSGAQLTVLATNNDGTRKFTFEEGDSWPDEWLPSGANAPCVYSLVVRCQCSVSPFFKGSSLPALAGITRPVDFTLASDSQWENTSRDPKSATLAYFMEE